VVVIGAGIVGLAVAYWFIRDGVRVTVVDRDPAGDKASFGNAASIAVTEVMPASAPRPIVEGSGMARRPAQPSGGAADARAQPNSVVLELYERGRHCHAASDLRSFCCPGSQRK
jgi:glycine/D-amino acid oxidase-like deaminating enzyme